MHKNHKDFTIYVSYIFHFPEQPPVELNIPVASNDENQESSQDEEESEKVKPKKTRCDNRVLWVPLKM